jgi:hypothetical protein
MSSLILCRQNAPIEQAKSFMSRWPFLATAFINEVGGKRHKVHGSLKIVVAFLFDDVIQMLVFLPTFQRSKANLERFWLNDRQADQVQIPVFIRPLGQAEVKVAEDLLDKHQ